MLLTFTIDSLQYIIIYKSMIIYRSVLNIISTLKRLRDEKGVNNNQFSRFVLTILL